MSRHSLGTERGSEKASDSVRPGSPSRRLGKTFYMPVRGGEVTADEAHAVGKHPLPISPSRDWFALFGLCKVLGHSEAVVTEPVNSSVPRQMTLVVAKRVVTSLNPLSESRAHDGDVRDSN